MALIHEAASGNIRELLDKCLDGGVRINDADKEHGRTALHYAAEKGHAPMVRYLLSRGANRGIVDVYGMTPLELAEENGHRQVIDILNDQEKSGPPRTVKVEGDTLLFHCQHCGEALRVPLKFAGAKGKCRACGEVVTAPQPPAPLPVFEQRTVTEYEEAVEIIFSEALAAVRVEDEQTIRDNYMRIAKSWRSDELIETSESGLKKIMTKNLRVIAFMADFQDFQILVDTQDVTAVQIIGHCSVTAHPRPLRIWRGQEHYYACGGPDFVPHP